VTVEASFIGRPANLDGAATEEGPIPRGLSVGRPIGLALAHAIADELPDEDATQTSHCPAVLQLTSGRFKKIAGLLDWADMLRAWTKP
jgi:hypothetical protein